MTDYSQLSDFEINNLVALAIGAKVTDGFRVGDSKESIYYALGEDEFCVRRGFGSMPIQFDPCNNPADAWLIIVGSKINIRFGAEGMACEAQFMQYGHESVDHYHTNPLRAAMIVFLMMQEKSK